MHEQQSAGNFRSRSQHRLARIHGARDSRNDAAIFKLKPVVSAGIIADVGVVEEHF